MFLVVCEILLVLYLLSEVSQRKNFTQAGRVLYTRRGGAASFERRTSEMDDFWFFPGFYIHGSLLLAGQQCWSNAACFWLAAFYLQLCGSLKQMKKKKDFPRQFFSSLFCLVLFHPIFKKFRLLLKGKKRALTRLLYSRIYACMVGIRADVHPRDAGGRLLSRIGVEKGFSSSPCTSVGKHLPCRPADERLVLPCDECQVSWLVR